MSSSYFSLSFSLFELLFFISGEKCLLSLSKLLPVLRFDKLVFLVREISNNLFFVWASSIHFFISEKEVASEAVLFSKFFKFTLIEGLAKRILTTSL